MQKADILTLLFICYNVIGGLVNGGFASLAAQQQSTLAHSSLYEELHQKVFATRCAQAGCHDGMFEPDFRTPQSTYNTLLYYPVVKNNLLGTFRYRVVSFDTAASLLFERITNCCFVNTNDRMPQDDPNLPLTDYQVDLVRQWIMAGAPDAFNRIVPLPDRQPFISQCKIYSKDREIDYSATRLYGFDFNPMLLPKSDKPFWVEICVKDDYVPARFLKKGELTVLTDFEKHNRVIYSTNKPHLTTDTTLFFKIPANDFPLNDTLYLHFRANDGAHDVDIEYPHKGINRYDVFKWSFIIR